MALLAYLLDERALANSVSLVAPETQTRAHLNLKWLEQQQLPEMDFTTREQATRQALRVFAQLIGISEGMERTNQ